MNRYDICGEKILQIIVDKSGRSFEQLCDDFGMPENSASHGLMELYYCLMSLNEVGLISVDGVEEDTESIDDFIQDALRNGSNGEKIRGSEKWRKIRSSLNDGWPPNERSSAYSISVSPLFGRPKRLSDNARLFVLMPFTDELKPIYTNHIIPISDELGLSVARADDIFTSNSLVSDIWTAICSAEVIIADCTGRNPNVFYEIGIAHTVGKPVILITQRSEDIPVDLRHMKYVRYDNSSEGMKIFWEKLKNTISSVLRESISA